ncbi:hypothetical protein RABR111495_07310 [Rahnella bruchi]
MTQCLGVDPAQGNPLNSAIRFWHDIFLSQG